MTNHQSFNLENAAARIEAQGLHGGMDGAFHAQSEALMDLAMASQLGRADAGTFSNPAVAAMLDGGPNGFHLFDNATGADTVLKTVLGGFNSLVADNTSNPWLPSAEKKAA